MNSKHIVTIAVLCITISTACKKDKDQTPEPSSSKPLEHPFLEVGNKWVYEVVFVDNLAHETLLGLDSTYIAKDTLINGVKWYMSITAGRDVQSQRSYVTFYRDSAGILINDKGIKIEDKVEKTGVIDSTIYIYDKDTLYEAYIRYKQGDTTVTVPAGTFKVKNIVTTYKIYNAPKKGEFVYKDTYNWYSKELGVSIYSTLFYMWPASVGMKDHYQTRLIRYKVQ